MRSIIASSAVLGLLAIVTVAPAAAHRLAAPTVGQLLAVRQMLLHGSTLDGVRLLAPTTVTLMTSNGLKPRIMRRRVQHNPIPGPLKQW